MERRVFVLLVLLIAAPARAQSIEAETLFNRGDTLMKQGQYAQACDAFSASNRLEQRAGTLIRLGECRERTNELASAWSAYKDALARAKDPKKKELAATKVKELEPRLSMLTISVADSRRVEGLVITRNGNALEAALWNVPVPVNGGTYAIAARAPGKQEWTTTITVGVEKDNKTVEVGELKAEAIATPTPAPSAQPPAPVVEPSETPPPSSPSSTFTTKRKVAVGFVGVAAIGLGIGIVLGTQSKAREDDANALCPDPDACNEADRANDLIQQARSRAIGADVAFGVAGAAVIGAAVLWFTGGATRDSGLAIVPGASSVSVTGRF